MENNGMKYPAELVLRMMEYEAGCPARIQHFLKVLSFAELIGVSEGLDSQQLSILKAAAVAHDIGIKPSLEKYGSASGPNQEIEGPPVARAMLEEMGQNPCLIDRVCYLISRHHTYNNIDGADYQILIEADFLVNIFEGERQTEQIKNIRNEIFRTKTGTKILDLMYPEAAKP